MDTFKKAMAACAAVAIFSTGAYVVASGVDNELTKKINAVSLAASPTVVDEAVIANKR